MERRVQHVQRWFQLLMVLQGGGRPTVPDLARRFGVTVRTVYRDLRALEDAGVPVRSDAGRWDVEDSYRLRPVHFTPQEVLALAAALDFARRRDLGGTAAASALEKLRAVMSGRQQELAAGLDQTLVVDPVPAQSLPPNPAVEQALTRAVQDGRLLRLWYHSLAGDEPTERVVRPYGLAYRGTALYLIGYCELRGELRTFRANRIQRAEVLPGHCRRPPDFDLEAYLTDIWGIEGGPLLDIRVRFSPPVARLATETRWHPTQAIEEEPDGSVVLCLRTRGLNEIARWLAGYGRAVEVLAPPELRAAVRAIGEGIVARYG